MKAHFLRNAVVMLVIAIIYFLGSLLIIKIVPKEFQWHFRFILGIILAAAIAIFTHNLQFTNLKKELCMKKWWYKNNSFLDIIDVAEFLTYIILILSSICLFVSLAIMLYSVMPPLRMFGFATWKPATALVAISSLALMFIGRFKKKWIVKPNLGEVLFKLNKEGKIIEFGANKILRCTEQRLDMSDDVKMWVEPETSFFSLAEWINSPNFDNKRRLL